MSLRTTQPGAKEQNGDVEASNVAIKRRLEQALLVRGSQAFETVADWQSFMDDVQRKANCARGQRVVQELAAMRELNVSRLPEYVEEELRVCERSTIRAKRCAYAVPSRLIGALLRVRIYEDRIEAYRGNTLELGCEHLHGDNRHRVDYRHVIWVVGPEAGGICAVRVPRGDGSVAGVPARVRRHPSRQARNQAGPAVPAHPGADELACAEDVWSRAMVEPAAELKRV